ncbi:uncharacterized protein FA14DRAFT_157008 [Meira miltonrushii]|uniref:Uncharacterized protein n=1 Tax=Meira miltonrushii TaxID=1280837 RepID=A0A316VDJ7_9BASI|nr:uncharacterized protein FA14DRAFT_157008 [Meira miltonrushii]PWN34343.1 hypothetical protein FA14DRAFT_157008 [Meira miltonrushii]
MMDPTGLYRPSLQRSNASTGSLPLVDSTNAPNNGKRKPSISTAKIAALNATAASVQSSPMASPALPRGNALLSPQRSYFDLSSRPSIDMARTESADSTRSLRSKSSKKDLKELGRSTTPLSSFGKSSSSRKASNADLKAQDDDDDSGLDESFTCCYGNEFDRQHRAALAKVANMPTTEDSEAAHQRWLDATFRKLSQKSVARHSQQMQGYGHHHKGRAPSLSASNMQRVGSIDEGCESEPMSPNAAKTHFLDFTSIISPIPSSNPNPNAMAKQQSLSPPGNTLQVPNVGSLGSHNANVTPRPSDFQRFPLPLTPSPVFHDALELQPASPRHAMMPPPAQPLLRSRRSEDSLTMRKRMQRQPSLPAAGPISPTYGEMTLDGHPVPRLPDWAKSENRMNSSSNVRSHNAQHSMEMARTASHNVTSSQQALHRPIDMSRATSQDTGSLQLSLGTPLMSHFDQWEERDNRALSPVQSVNMPARSQSSMDQRPVRPHVQPLKLTNETSHRRNMMNNSSTSSAASVSTTGSSSFHINRESVSSAASDSDISSSISSVPQTPVSKFNNLPNSGPIIMHRDGHVNSVYYDADPISEHNIINNAGTEDQLATIRAVVGGWAEDKSKSAPPTAQIKTPRAHDGRRFGSVPHVANIFTASEALSNVSQTQGNKSSQRSPDSKAVLHGKAIHGRPRANTTSSMTPSSSSDVAAPVAQIHVRNGSESKPSREHVTSIALPTSPERVSSLSHARKHSDGSRRASVASNISNNSASHSVISATSSSVRSSGSSGSGASALLSYMRSNSSKSQTSLHGRKTSETDANKTAKTPSSSSGSTLHAGSPSSSSDTATSSPIKRGAMSAEELAHSIGRRFGRGIAAASAANRA